LESKKAEKEKNIFINGSAEIVNKLLKENLLVEFYISIIPILLSSGVRLFKDGRAGRNRV
jgi:dihydrofolate reductase